MKRLVRFIFLASLVAAVAAAVRALLREQDPLPAPPTGPGGGPWPPLQNPSPTVPRSDGDATRGSAAPGTPPAPRPSAAPTPDPADDDTPSGTVAPEPAGVPVGSERTAPSGATWVEPASGGGCPDGYPIKANLKSKIFHAPGQLNYDRTSPDRCYASADAAEADGLRAAKR